MNGNAFKKLMNMEIAIDGQKFENNETDCNDKHSVALT